MKVQNMNVPLPNMPEELWEIRDAAVEHVLTNAPLPPDIERLYEWLESDGWDALIDAWVDEELVMNLEKLSSYFSDSELEDDTITNGIRVEHARWWISKSITNSESLDDFDFKSVHSYEIKRQDGKSAIIGCTIASMGQSGDEVVWYGVFPTRREFLNRLKESGYWVLQDIEAIDDATILALWQKDK
jgi:hypothetical protein